MIEQFEIHVDDSILDDLRRRLARTRIPDQIGGTGWDYGIPMDYLGELIDYWLAKYDWRDQEMRLNEVEHFRTTIDGQSIHFIHHRSPRDDAFPILLTHGWPGSVVEFLDVIDHLEDEFDLVVPSLPGYGFSEPTKATGWDPWRVARAFAQLMERLGYDRYGAQGGDWGSQVTTRIGALDEAHCAGIHLNMTTVDAPKDQVPLSDGEKADLASMARFQREEVGYALEQMTKPQTLGASLNDSPAGLLAWIVEKFRTWSDCDGDPENVFTRDQLITNVMTYWVTGTITSSMRLYWELMHTKEKPPEYVSVPTGIARYPKEIFLPPRAWIERRYNVTYWSELPRGGHFAAMEQPELFAEDVRTFFRTVQP